MMLARIPDGEDPVRPSGAANNPNLEPSLTDPEPSSGDNSRRVEKQEGVTAAERYLAKLCQRSFLSLWSYPAVFRDQGKSTSGHGKEVADHLVVFEDDIIIFSDKDIAWNNSKSLQVAWERWHRSAVLEGAKQLWGAERWIRSFPQRLFLDRACTVPFPVPLPDAARARFHLVLIAHGSAEACRNHFGGSGSLMLLTAVGGASTAPFTIGDLDRKRSFIHVLDDTTLDVVMKHCDTVRDFVGYLTKKERLIRSDRLGGAAGEEELLAHYLGQVDAAGEHDFVLPPDITQFYFDEGSYLSYLRHPQAVAKARADEPSYLWDHLIEAFSKNVLNDTLYHSSGSGIAHHEQSLRMLAREPRVRRRQLAKSLIDLATAKQGDSRRRVRVAAPTHLGDPYFLLMLLKSPEDFTYERYRVLRRELLLHYVRTVCLIDPRAEKVVGLAMDFPSPEPSSEDLVLLDGRDLTGSERREAQQKRIELNLLMEVREFRSIESEYPRGLTDGTIRFTSGLHRNAPCPCGSGKKYRLCCRRPSPFMAK